MKTLLLTGFEPFLDYTINPTMRVVERLDGERIGDYQIISRILPVDFKRSGQRILEWITELEPDAVVSLGLAAGRYKITPERVALNVKDGDQDNEGYRPVDEPISATGPDAYLSTLPVRKMTQALIEAGLPAEISNTAGAYLCNNIMYEGLRYAATNKPDMLSGFIHIPADHQLAIEHGKLPSWSHEDLARGVRICLETMGQEELESKQ
ncbi:pyroglutamyl-peptidase I [Planococcus sp. CP5-4]|uniref:pyroglutamyl-peptidase I n=1 Tax=unclassified Planococcus (in: firmicutes) TaxID=2662419 RepID=UPI001C227829|nr:MULTISPECIES: pyroglutamyl-peptidase I [unclassified Planococcus (in: firmicutes)]MBU9673635.1 pyroglutamyl-peptidase I [Planococcus sp. CP5-4_YE]MBV0907925.1 pyroglutamyl-peptidase I [Planococcus sp. CP5-4_UN]MBW6063092.1 pyroglutamyl-peptidase I [Planococcus sp. CP5-4]